MSDTEHSPQRRQPWLAIGLVIILTAIAIWLVPSEEPQVIELPPATPSVAEAPHSAPMPAPSPAAGKPVGQTARELIAAQRSAGKPDPDAAFQRARELARAGQAEDAYLLDFYAARLGHADAAFALAERADPAYWQQGNPLKEPAPAQALRWYRAAAEGGNPDAKTRLEALRSWATKAAAKGDAEAQRLMLAWQ